MAIASSNEVELTKTPKLVTQPKRGASHGPIQGIELDNKYTAPPIAKLAVSFGLAFRKSIILMTMILPM